MNRWPITVELPLQWGDQDSFGHANNVLYLRWFESARIAWFERAGVMSKMETERIGPILARQTIDYRLPLTYPDRLRVSATATRLGTTSFTMGLQLRSENRGGAVAAEGESVIVMIDYRTQAKVPLWESLRESIAALEASS